MGETERGPGAWTVRAYVVLMRLAALAAAALTALCAAALVLGLGAWMLLGDRPGVSLALAALIPALALVGVAWFSWATVPRLCTAALSVTAMLTAAPLSDDGGDLAVWGAGLIGLIAAFGALLVGLTFLQETPAWVDRALLAAAGVLFLTAWLYAIIPTRPDWEAHGNLPGLTGALVVAAIVAACVGLPTAVLYLVNRSGEAADVRAAFLETERVTVPAQAQASPPPPRPETAPTLPEQRTNEQQHEQARCSQESE